MKSLWNDCDDHLYVFESSCGHVKVGRTRDVDARMRSILAMCPPSVTLSVLAVAENHGDWEYGLHEYLAEFRVRGEWFSARAGQRLRELLQQAPLALVVRRLAKRTGKRKAIRLTGPNDRRGRRHVARRRNWTWNR